MAMTEYQKRWERERRENGTASKNISVKLTQADLQIWQAYAQDKGYEKVTSLVRECVNRCMQMDEWTMDSRKDTND